MSTYTITYDDGSRDTFPAEGHCIESKGVLRIFGVQSPEGLHPFDTFIVNLDKVRSIAVRNDAPERAELP